MRAIIDRWVQRDEPAFARADHGVALDADEQRRRWLLLSLLVEDGLDEASYRAASRSPPRASRARTRSDHGCGHRRCARAWLRSISRSATLGIVSDALETALALRFSGARSTRVGNAVHAEIPRDGAVYRARLAMTTDASVAVSLPSTDGFELSLRWTDRWTAAPAPRAPVFDDSFLVETNDLALANVWLDHDARAALLASRYVARKHPIRATALMLRDARWTHTVSNDEVGARRRGHEASCERMADMLDASLYLATRPVRWARGFAAIARALGGQSAARIEVGGKPALRVRRGAIDVLVRLVRRLGPGDPGRLRTIVTAHRHGSSGETLSLIAESTPRAAWPVATEASPSALRVDARAAQLLELSHPSATTVRRHDVEISFDGALSDRDRLGAAVELAARWAGHTPDAHPYR